MANEERKNLADAMRTAAEYVSIDIDGFVNAAEFLLEDISAEIERMEEANFIMHPINRIAEPFGLYLLRALSVVPSLLRGLTRQKLPHRKAGQLLLFY